MIRFFRYTRYFNQLLLARIAMSSGDHGPSHNPPPNNKDLQPRCTPLPAASDHTLHSFSRPSHVGEYTRQPQLWTYTPDASSIATQPKTFQRSSNQARKEVGRHTTRRNIVTTASMVSPEIISTERRAINISAPERPTATSRLGKNHKLVTRGGDYDQGFTAYHGSSDDTHSTVALAVSNYVSSQHQCQSYQQQQQQQKSQRVQQPGNLLQPNSNAPYYTHEQTVSLTPTAGSTNSNLAESCSLYYKPSLPQSSKPHTHQESRGPNRNQQSRTTGTSQVYQQASRQQEGLQADQGDRFSGQVLGVASAASFNQTASASSTTPCISAVGRQFASVNLSLQQQSTDSPARQPLVAGLKPLPSQQSSEQGEALQTERGNMSSHNPVAHQRQHCEWVSPRAIQPTITHVSPELNYVTQSPQQNYQQPYELPNTRQEPSTQRPQSQQLKPLIGQHQQYQRLDQLQLGQEQRCSKDELRQNLPRQEQQRKEQEMEVEQRREQEVQHQARDYSKQNNRTSSIRIQEKSKPKPRLYLPEPVKPKPGVTEFIKQVGKETQLQPRGGESQSKSPESYHGHLRQILSQTTQHTQTGPRFQCESELEPCANISLSPAQIRPHQSQTSCSENVPQQQKSSFPRPLHNQHHSNQYQIHQYKDQAQVTPVVSSATVYSSSMASIVAGGHKDEPQPIHDFQQCQQPLQYNVGPYQRAAYWTPSIPDLVGQEPVDRALMEQRMRELVGTMRFYQSKDPSAFHSVWESVRKETGKSTAITSGGQSHFQQRASSVGMNTSLSAAAVTSTVELATNAQSIQRQNHERGQSPASLNAAADIQQQGMSGENYPSSRVPRSPASSANPAQSNEPRGMPEPEKAVVAAAAADFLTRSGKSIAAEYISGFLQRTNNFVTMCEHFDSLGHKFDRGDLARFLLDSVNGEQIKRKDAVIAASVSVDPLPQKPEEPGRVLGEVEDRHDQLLQESNSTEQSVPQQPSNTLESHDVLPSTYQTAPYSAALSQSATQWELMKNEAGCPRNDGCPPGSVPKRWRANSIPTVVVTPAAVTQHLYQTVPVPQPVSVSPGLLQTSHKHTSPFFSVLSGSNSNPSSVPSSHHSPFKQFSTVIPMKIQNDTRPVRTSNEASGCQGDMDAQETLSKDPTIVAPSTRTQAVTVRNDFPLGSVVPGYRTAGKNALVTSGTACFSGLPTIPSLGPVIIDLTNTHDSAVSGCAVGVTRKHHQSKQPLAEKISRHKAARVSKYNPKDIARSILIVARKHPTERSLNAHLLQLPENLPGQIDWNSDLETIRWDMLDPNSIAVDIEIDMDGDQEGDGNNSLILTDNVLYGKRISTNLTLLIPKKRTRPKHWRKSKGDLPSQVTPKSAEAQISYNVEQAAPSSAPLNATTSRHLESNNNHSMRSQSPRTAPMESGPISKRRRTTQPTRVTQQNRRGAVFKKYRCKWKDCTADLHNVENLKRHVVKLHKRKHDNIGGYPCQWMGCFQSPTTEQISEIEGRMDRSQPMTWCFASEGDWENHVDSHIDAVKQAYGLGPAALLSGKTNLKQRSVKSRMADSRKIIFSPIDQDSGASDIDYLSDHTGQQVTPVARPSNPSHKFVPPFGFRSTKQFNIAHGVSIPDRRSSFPSYRQALERIRILGAGMEGDEAGQSLAVNNGRGIQTECKRIVSADWPPKPKISTAQFTSENRHETSLV
ncbi:hypothetical protein K440DRAFT_640152 [Wilcoxina mikolae CBS 423.85]|nr:hypothetical protein K440DRAFT_640152 [Wilcoxina mikolae CBS 423.85]